MNERRAWNIPRTTVQVAARVRRVPRQELQKSNTNTIPTIRQYQSVRRKSVKRNEMNWYNAPQSENLHTMNPHPPNKMNRTVPLKEKRKCCRRRNICLILLLTTLLLLAALFAIVFTVIIKKPTEPPHSTTAAVDTCSMLRWNQTGILHSGISSNPFTNPLGLSIDSSDTLYICDHYYRGIETWSPGAVNGTRVTDSGGLHANYVVFDKNNSFYINQHTEGTVRRYSMISINGTIVAGNGTSSSALNNLNYPLGIDLDDDNNIYIADRSNARVMKRAPSAINGTLLINMTLSNISTVLSSLRLAKDSSNQVYLSDGSYNRVYLWSFGNTYPDIILNQVRNSTVLSGPKDLIFDPYKNLYIAENSVSGRVLRYCPSSTVGETVIQGDGTASSAKVGIAFDSKLNLYALLSNGTVIRYDLL